MERAEKLKKFGLNPDNSIVIGSGILNALNIRASEDLDITVPEKVYKELQKSGDFSEGETHGRPVLRRDGVEVGYYWGVLGKDQSFDDLKKHSVVIDGVRYITIEFLLAVKKSWLEDDEVRQKDIKDVKLIKKYLKE